MRHRKAGRKLNRTSSHRKALYKNAAVALIQHDHIKTTLAKAKALRPHVERLVTLARRGDTVACRRLIFSRLRDAEAMNKLFVEIAARYATRPGGYLRIVRCGFRPGDSAPMAILQWVN